MIRLMIALAATSVAFADLAAAAADIDPFVGRWSGKMIETEASIPAETIGIEISERAGGFQLAWKDLARNDEGTPSTSPLKARFVATSRPGVFEFAREPSSFLDRMFASPTTGNPLEGETLLWARLGADTLAVYSLTIDRDGGFDLSHYTWTRTGDALALLYRERTQELGEQVIVEGRLVPAGG
jgi:hypothetical protein